jgi:hypothetical protein
MNLDDRIDDLYKRPLAEFTSARNALAKTLAGDDAKRVKALAKPTVVPWAVNQLYWHARKAYDRLLDKGARLRKAQLAALSGKGDANALREATDAHRAAVAEAARETNRIAGTGAQHLDPLTRMLEALSLATEPPEHPGRFTKALQPAGFEALAGVKPAAAAFPRAAEKKRVEAEKQAAKKHEEEIAKAEADVERARDAEAFARKTLERATRALADAEERLTRTRDRS